MRDAPSLTATTLAYTVHDSTRQYNFSGSPHIQCPDPSPGKADHEHARPLDCDAAAGVQVVAVYLSQTALFKTLNLFPPEKLLVREERARGAYGALPYFLSKVLAELPIAALFPLVFSAIVYPMTNLQPTVPPPSPRYADVYEAACALQQRTPVPVQAPTGRAQVHSVLPHGCHVVKFRNYNLIRHCEGVCCAWDQQV